MNEWERRRYEKSKLAYNALMKFYPLTLEDLPDELWKPVPDYEGYHVSNFGRIKRIYKNGKLKILNPTLIRKGYPRVCLCKDNQKKTFLVHRLVAKTFIPNPENKPQVNHLDGCKLNNHVSNLEWATQSENMRHAYDTGLKVNPQGEDTYNAKLTNEQARYIRENPDDLSIYKLAEMFSVYPTKISAIQLGKTYQGAGGVIRAKKQSGSPRVPDDIREQIRAEYQEGVRGQGSYALAKKYGLVHSTVLTIIHET